MTKQMHFKSILCLLTAIVCLCCQSALSERIDNSPPDKLDIGRDDPFAKFVTKKEPVASQPEPEPELKPQPQPEPLIIEKPPPRLFVETIALKFLDSKSLATVIESMISEYGSISINEKGNALIICDTKENLARIVEEVRKADRIPAQIMFAETVILKFLDAKNLKKALDNMSSKYGIIEADDNTNSLIVCDTKSNLEKIIAEIKKADQTPEQIMIEVVIVDVQLEDDTEIGVNWDHLKGLKNFKQTLVSTLDTTGVKGADFGIFKDNIAGTLHALQETRKVEILASPRVLVVSGQEAQIQTVEEIPYTETTGTAEGGANALSSTQFKEVGVTLTVKATLIDGMKILLTIEPKQSVKTGETGVGANDVPVVDKRTARTTLLMEDGQVVVMGGLRRKETKISSDKIPLLGDLPILGHLFSNNKKEIEHSELIVLLSPHIYKGQSLTDEQISRFNELKNSPPLRISWSNEPKNVPKNVYKNVSKNASKNKPKNAAASRISTQNRSEFEVLRKLLLSDKLK
jgi:type II secretory pathway component GspD/PulD (secretin)